MANLMGRVANEEETLGCYKLASDMMRSIPNADRRLMFGAVSMIAQFIFDTTWTEEEDKRQMFQEWVDNLKDRLFKEDA
jgi:hypothetical protein